MVIICRSQGWRGRNDMSSDLDHQEAPLTNWMVSDSDYSNHGNRIPMNWNDPE